MDNEFTQHFLDLLFSGVLAAFVWRYYRKRTLPASEKYATFGPRFWTGCVDSCVLWPIGFLSAIILSCQVPRFLAALVVAAQSLIWLAYTAQMHAHYGQTVGKMATKVRVVEFPTEKSITLRQAWLRESIPAILSLGLVGYQIALIMIGDIEPNAMARGKALTNNKTFWLLTALPGLWFLAEVLTMLTNEKRRALHDFIAGTVVIRTNTETMISPQGASPEDGGASEPLTLN